MPIGDKANATLTEKMTAILKDGKPIEVSFLRGAEKLSTKITPEKICTYPVTMSQDDIVNAFADGEKVVIAKGMMRFTKDDTELSLVVSHELAHNSMKHMNAKKTNATLGAILDAIAAAYRVNTQNAFANAAANAYSQDFEAEADYVGLYYDGGCRVRYRKCPKVLETYGRRPPREHKD